MIQSLKDFFQILKFIGVLIATPVAVVWRIVIRPQAIILYKLSIVLRARLKVFFHSQHKVLAVITHQFAIHGLVGILTFTIVTVNLIQANEVRAEEFAEGSLVAQIFSPDNETVITAETIAPTSTSYIDTSSSVKITPSIKGGVALENEGTMFAGGGSSVVKSNVIGVENPGGSSIQTYEVQGGDTVSSIAEQFDISTKTIEWANNLEDGKVIKPGDTLYILPTSGVPHTVKSGETVSSIAQKYEANVDDIITYNDFIGARDLEAGVEIIIPGGKKPAPPPEPRTTRLASFQSVFGGSEGSAPPNAAPSGGNLQWPTTCSRVSQYYGWRHKGIDIDCEFGNAIYAGESGNASVGWYSGYGLQVVINHGNGMQTRYAHLQKSFVSNGQSVSRGQAIGEMGSTGWSSGSHLHFEVIVGGSTTNPFNYL